MTATTADAITTAHSNGAPIPKRVLMSGWMFWTATRAFMPPVYGSPSWRAARVARRVICPA